MHRLRQEEKKKEEKSFICQPFDADRTHAVLRPEAPSPGTLIPVSRRVQRQVYTENTSQCLPLGEYQTEKSSRVSLDGVVEGDPVACGRLCGRTRTIPGTDSIRFDPISDNGNETTRVFPPRVIFDRKRPVLCDKCQFSLVSEARRHRDIIEISSSAFRVRSDTRSTPAVETPTAHLCSSPR
ncbi:hypothetical protein ALC62_13695 [Cyphomyrmex costatus]|uniref:Uncharacterized protein n=1 Tax=Cyphomyrmex costatus TaxID=456900 RepID=A0A195C4P2_9HYME|nr:hypothetical protein ALC62_13695 [Cyphomyrmex costatus]